MLRYSASNIIGVADVELSSCFAFQYVNKVRQDVNFSGLIGSWGGIRTPDQVVNSHPLCRLSYPGISSSRGISATLRPPFRTDD